jgi:hypothetical protein
MTLGPLGVFGGVAAIHNSLPRTHDRSIRNSVEGRPIERVGVRVVELRSPIGS